jgi:hypothetical protein
LTPWILMMIIEKSLVFVLVTSNPNRIESNRSIISGGISPLGSSSSKCFWVFSFGLRIGQ